MAAYIQQACRISIHAPHARSDLTLKAKELIVKFQSTLLMRGATFATATSTS